MNSAYRERFIREHKKFIDAEVKRLDKGKHNKTTNERHMRRLREKIIDDMISQQTRLGCISKVKKDTYFKNLIRLDPVEKSSFWKQKLDEMDRVENIKRKSSTNSGLSTHEIEVQNTTE
jgi:hypothetical protein